jgi:hypothetical protein
MYELKKNIGKEFTSKFVGSGPSSYKRRIYRAVVSQRLRNIALHVLSTYLVIVRRHCIYNDRYIFAYYVGWLPAELEWN